MAVMVAAMVGICAPTYAQVPVQLEQVGAIGVMSGDPDFEFGDIYGIDVDERNTTIFAFDRLNLRLSAFAIAGRFIDAVGRRGGGPGEFLSPNRPVVVGSTVHMIDALNARISQWELRDGRLLQTGEKRLQKPLSGRSCGTDGHIFIVQYDNGGLVQKLDPVTLAVRSFGAPFHEARGLNHALMGGRITCRDDGVYVASQDLPTLRKYRSSGELVWETTIPGIVAPEIQVDANGIPQYRRPSDQWPKAVVSMVASPDRRLLVQMGLTRTFAPGHQGTDIVDVETVVYDAETGRVLERRNDLPRVDYAGGDHAFNWASDPFPQVRIFRWR